MKSLMAISLLMLMLVPGATSATTPCIPPKLEQLRGVWLGGGDLGGIARLALDKAGRGTLIIKERPEDSPVSIYRVAATKISGYELGFALEPVGWPPKTALTGEAECGRITLNRLIRGTRPRSQEFHFLPEKDFLHGVEAVQRASPGSAR
jgi:hypothetical protein